MLIELIIGQLFLALFNVANVHIDAYRILNNKTIAHGINFTAYIICASILCLLLWFSYTQSALFLLSAFFNRQFSFDIPLNLRRGLAWYYQSTAKPPKALLDRIERAIFGTASMVGKKIATFYAACYCILITVWIWTQ